MHALGVSGTAALPITERDALLLIVPMFHVNAWGIPYSGWLAGADLIMPERFLQAEPLSRLIALARPTCSSGVPTIWSELLRFAETHDVDLSSMRIVTSGGSALPRSLLERFEERFGVAMVQGWGMRCV